MLGDLLLLWAILGLACLAVIVVLVLDRAQPNETHPDIDKIDWPPSD